MEDCSGHAQIMQIIEKLNAQEKETKKVEVIRCRECGFSTDEMTCTHPRWFYGQNGVIVYPPVSPDGYCAWAVNAE